MKHFAPEEYGAGVALRCGGRLLTHAQAISDLMIEAAQLGPADTHHTVATRRINGRRIDCIGRNAERVTREGWRPVVVLRWRLDGRPATKLAIVRTFGSADS